VVSLDTSEAAAIADERAGVAAQVDACRERQVEELDGRTRELLGAIFARALEDAPGASREALRRCWTQMVAYQLEGQPIADILRRDEGVAPGDPGWKDAAARFHTAQTRARARLAAAREAMISDGSLSAEDATLAENSLRRLYRRQQRTRRDVSTGDR
jgi:hypothetical protein